MATKIRLKEAAGNTANMPKTHLKASSSDGGRKATNNTRLINSDECAHSLVAKNLLFVHHVAKRYRNLGLPFEDLVSEGYIGMIEAAYRFNPAKGTEFTTYAVWWVRKSILRALSERSTIKVPMKRTNAIRQLKTEAEALARILGRRPTRAEIAVFAKTTIEKLDAVSIMNRVCVSLDVLVGKNKKTPLYTILVDPAATTAQRSSVLHQDLQRLANALQDLSTTERKIIAARFGLDGDDPRTLKKTAAANGGISSERVRQIERTALNKLRKHLNVPTIPPPKKSGKKKKTGI